MGYALGVYGHPLIRAHATVTSLYILEVYEVGVGPKEMARVGDEMVLTIEYSSCSEVGSDWLSCLLF
jgi:hypothetical protein